MIGPTTSQYERDCPLNIYRDSPFQYGFNDARFPTLLSVVFLAQAFQKAMCPLLTSPGCLEYNWFEAKLLRIVCLQNSLVLSFDFCIRSRNTSRVRGLSPYRHHRVRRYQREIQSYLRESLTLVLLQKGNGQPYDIRRSASLSIRQNTPKLEFGPRSHFSRNPEKSCHVRYNAYESDNFLIYKSCYGGLKYRELIYRRDIHHQYPEYPIQVAEKWNQ